MKPMATLLPLLIAAVGYAQSTEKVPQKPVPKPKPQAAPMPTDPAELLRLANAAFQRGEWAKAIDLYDRLLQVDPENLLGAQRKAEAKANMEKQRQAEREARAKAEAQQIEAVRLANERKKLPLYLETAKGLIQDGKWQDAEGYLTKIEAMEPDHPILQASATRSARIELRRGELREAMKGPGCRQALEEAMARLQALSPNDPLIAEAKANPAIGTYAGQTWSDPVSGLTFCWVPAGSFDMGSNNGDDDEKPVHRVTLSKGFWMSKTETTQSQWQGLIGSNPSSFQGSDKPVENVSWNDAKDFLNRLNDKGGMVVYRLPTEAEWEYACRAASTGDRYGDLEAIAWYYGNSDNTTHPVGQKQANAWGLRDMLGNVLEWCEDWKGDYTYGSVTDPTDSKSGSYRVSRGGSWGNDPSDVRSAYRADDAPDLLCYLLGFRVVAIARTP